MILLGALFFVLAYRNETEERRKFEEFKASCQVTNPLKSIWVWVCLNLVGQIISEVENGLIYSYYGGDECYPSQVLLPHPEQHPDRRPLPPLPRPHLRHQLLQHALVLQSQEAAAGGEPLHTLQPPRTGGCADRCGQPRRNHQVFYQQ